jgi:PPOX class probable F420-dependent enzyme
VPLPQRPPRPIGVRVDPDDLDDPAPAVDDERDPRGYGSGMDLDLARDFVRRNHRAVLTTYFPDGRAQLSPVLVGVDDGGHVVISTRETAVKTHNIARDPRVVLCGVTEAFFGQWLLIEGQAEVVHLPDAMEPLVNYYRDISGEHPDWDDYRATMERDRRVILRITITRAGPDRQG